jgi:aminoglycoside phosphotransferase (APT) family kinase protein
VHPDQIDVPVATVRALVDDQFPQWHAEPVTPLESQGTVNAIFRIGEGLTARFPLRGDDPDEARRWLDEEAAAARELLGRTRFRTPEPVAVGAPGAGYPLPWSVQTWVPGTVATEADPGDATAFADDLAEFIAAVRAIDPRGRTWPGYGRGGDLHRHDEWMRTCLARSESLLDVPRLRRLWDELRELPRGDYPDTMNHGDLIPGNVLVAGGRLTGVLDVGGLGVADRALDLVAAWHLLAGGPRRRLRERLACGDLEWQRGRAWAFEQAMGVVWYYRDSNPAMSAMGRRTLDRILREGR